MLASARQMLAAGRFVRDGRWLKAPISSGRSVGRKTMGVGGLVGTGRATADRGAAFGMRVCYSGSRTRPDPPYTYVSDLVRE